MLVRVSLLVLAAVTALFVSKTKPNPPVTVPVPVQQSAAGDGSNFAHTTEDKFTTDNLSEEEEEGRTSTKRATQKNLKTRGYCRCIFTCLIIVLSPIWIFIGIFTCVAVKGVLLFFGFWLALVNGLSWKCNYFRGKTK